MARRSDARMEEVKKATSVTVGFMSCVLLDTFQRLASAVATFKSIKMHTEKNQMELRVSTCFRKHIKTSPTSWWP